MNTPRKPVKKKSATEVALAPLVTALSSGVARRFNAGQVVNLDWSAEKRYALAILQDPNNDYLLDCARANPGSLAEAMLDLSRVGLSLSPTLKQAYLIPYNTKGVKKVTLCPSYIGMEQGVLRSGKVTVIQTELVYENDSFERWTDDTGAKFKHVPARKDRGALEGGYCLAKFANGETHLEYMEVAEIDACEEAATRKNNGKITPAWRYFKPEMQKKVIVRRAAKHWPTDKHVEAIFEVMDRSDPMDFGGPDDTAPEAQELCLSPEQVATMEAALTQVPETQRGVWLQRMAEAMGYPGGPKDIPERLYEAATDRLVARMHKLYGAPAATEAQP